MSSREFCLTDGIDRCNAGARSEEVAAGQEMNPITRFPSV
jgi:hypothetical protein